MIHVDGPSLEGAGEESKSGAAGAKPSPKPRRSDQTRARILDAAEEVFGKRGYHGSSVVEITRQAGVGLGTFYLYFPSKIEIYRHLLRSRQEEFIQAARKAYQGATDQRTIVEGAFGAFFEWMARRPMVLRMMREAEFVEPNLIVDLYTMAANEFRERLGKAMELGTVRKTDPEVLAWCLMGMAEFTTLRWIVWTGSGTMDRERFEAFAQIMGRALGVEPDAGDAGP